ncbi:hypothetical protein, partial [Salmonella enterica]|uniref:hypothetical protein n=1 Tax=Salmonella enterica TaxID=28901 RepID=UPI0020C26A75
PNPQPLCRQCPLFPWVQGHLRLLLWLRLWVALVFALRALWRRLEVGVRLLSLSLRVRRAGLGLAGWWRVLGLLLR